MAAILSRPQCLTSQILLLHYFHIPPPPPPPEKHQNTCYLPNLILHSYLAGVAAAELSSMNVVKQGQLITSLLQFEESNR